MVRNSSKSHRIITAIRFFGPLEELVGVAQSKLEIIVPQSESSLRKAIDDSYPSLEGKAFRLAIDEELVKEGQVINHVQEISCLPPFAGG